MTEKIVGDQLKTEEYAFYLAHKVPRTHLFAPAFSVMLVVYVFCPHDLIPYSILVLDYLEAMVLKPLEVSQAIKMIPLEVMMVCREQAKIEQITGLFITP